LNEIRISQNTWEKVCAHLFETSGEHFVFLLAEVANIGKGITLLVNDVILIPSEDTEAVGFALQIKLDALLKVTNTALKRKMALIEVHNHSSGFGSVDFSGTDRKGFKEFVPYVLDVIPGKPYAAIVVTDEPSVEGLIWKNQDKPESISYIRIIGKNFRKLVTTSGKRLYKNEVDEKTFARQILAFGKPGQKKIHSVKVAIVGTGGIGSYVAQELAYKGVRDFVLVDPDLVEETNLNRLVGATPNDIGKPKVNVIERMITSITGNKAKVTSLQKNLRNTEVFNILKQADIIFGCVDNDGARLILTQLASSYLIHYIDCGTGINISNEIIEEAGGRVMVSQPNGPCMTCANMIDLKEVLDNLSSKEEYENRKKMGYVRGANIPDASVISLNGVIASLAVVEFMVLVTGMREARILTMYDMLAGREPAIVPCHVNVNENCLHHSFIGIGDKIELTRYLKEEGTLQI